MNIQTHEDTGAKIAEVLSNEILIANAEEGLQLLVDLYYQDFDKIILHEKNITPAFFDLKTGLAGEILQKYANYKVRLVIVGEFSKYPRNSIKDFVSESNRGRQVNFLATVEQAVKKLSA